MKIVTLCDFCVNYVKISLILVNFGQISLILAFIMGVNGEKLGGLGGRKDDTRSKHNCQRKQKPHFSPNFHKNHTIFT